MSNQTNNLSTDRVIDELHATRLRMWQEHGGLSGLAEFLRQEEAKSTHPVVDRSNSADRKRLQIGGEARETRK